jgi:hypothetical protein
LLEAGAHRGCQGRPSLCAGRTRRRFQAASWQPRARRHAGCGRDDTSEGSSLSGHEELAPQPCIRWVTDPNHDARMRIGGEAPRRWAHS